MNLLSEQYVTPKDYLIAERLAVTKHEYYQGEIFAMTGASRRHNLISVSLTATLYSQLRKRNCEMYANDMRVKVIATGLYCYPDVVVVCGQPGFDDEHKDTLLNPTLLIEVLSDSTEGYDRGKKFEHYRRLDSLQDYLLVAQQEVHIEHYQRCENGWLLSEAKGLNDVIRIDSLECELALAEIYEKVDFESLENF